VGGGVFADRVVAATDVPTGLAHPQMDPAPAGRQALLTTLDLVRQVEEVNRVEMGAFSRRRAKIQPPST
jgi:hypothetical protein